MPIAVYVPSRITEFIDVPVPGASEDAKALTYDHDTGDMAWVAFEAAGAVAAHAAASDPHTGYLLADGSRTGARSSRQVFTNGVTLGTIRPAIDSTTALRVQNAVGSSDVLTVDTTNGRITVVGDQNQFRAQHSAGNSAFLSVQSSQLSFYTTADIPFVFSTDNKVALVLRSGASRNTVIARGTTSQTGQYFRVETSAQAHVFSVRPVSSSDQTGVVAVGVDPATARLDIVGGTTALPPLRIRSGVAPTSPNDGDIWFDGTNFKCRIGGVTKTFTVT